MKSKLVRIGNSRGIRLPKTVLEQCGFEDMVEMDVQDNRVVIRPANETRGGWDEAFAKMVEQGDDRLLDTDADPRTEWDETEWRW